MITIQLCEYTKPIEMYTLMDMFYISLKLLQKEKNRQDGYQHSERGGKEQGRHILNGLFK